MNKFGENELNKLNNALLNAQKAALRESKTEDGGTCNFDFVTIKINIPRKYLQRTAVNLEKMLVSDWGRTWEGHYRVKIPLLGQANRRTNMAEAACQSLLNDGYEAFMFYMMD